MIDQYVTCDDTYRCLSQLQQDGLMAVATSHHHATYNDRISDYKIYCFMGNDNIYKYPVAMFIQVNHPMAETINRHIRMAFEGGLFVKWEADNRIDQIDRIVARSGPFQLTLEHLFTPMSLLSVFMAFSIGAFIAEHIVYSHIQKRNCGRFWQISNMLIDPERHYFIQKIQ